MKLLVKDEFLSVYEDIPHTFMAKDMRQHILKKFNKTFDTQTMHNELVKMIECNLIRRAPPDKYDTPSRRYIKNFSFLSDWWNEQMVEIKKLTTSLADQVTEEVISK